MPKTSPVLTEETAATIGDCLTTAQVFKLIPYETVDEALRCTDRRKRRLRVFPDHLVAYFVVLMALFMEHSYGSTLSRMQAGLEWLDQIGGFKEISESAIVQARERLSFLPLQRLFELVARPLASPNDLPTAYYRELLLVALDGAVFDVEDSVSNQIGFGKPKNQAGEGAYPQVQSVALIELATRAVIDVAFAPIATTSEYYLAKSLLLRLRPKMLILGDRLYSSYENCQTIISTGAHFLMRVRKDLKLVPEEILEDGSYLAKLYEYVAGRRTGEFMIVRVIPYRLSEGGELYRLITSLLESEKAPAEELAALYPRRWNEETFFSEIKTVLRQPRIVLRSRSPAMVIQELYGLFLAHYVIRSFMYAAAAPANISPTELSFKNAVSVVKHAIPMAGDFPP